MLEALTIILKYNDFLQYKIKFYLYSLTSSYHVA